MKKNVMMRVASILLVMVLMTSSVISGTFAKYVTQDAGADEARVAKWGIALQVVGDLYGVSYTNGIVASAYDIGNGITVQAENYAVGTTNVVAPGTLNAEGMSFGLTGTPEVDYKIKATVESQNIFLKDGSYAHMIPVEAGKITAQNFANFASELYTGGAGSYTKAAAFDPAAKYFTMEENFTLVGNYYPVVYTMTGATGDNQVDTTNHYGDSLEQIAVVVANALAGDATLVTANPPVNQTTTRYIESKVYDTNIPINSLGLSNMVITWEWAYERTDNMAMYDAADTVLGNLIAGTFEGEIVKTTDGGATYVALEEYTDYCLDTQFSIDITVTQVN